MPKEHLVNTVETCLRDFDGKRQKNKFFAFGLKLTIAAISATITVLLGLAFPGKDEGVYKNAALVLSALSMVIATWDAFFQHRTLWVRYTVAANRLRSLLQEIRYFTAMHEGVLPTSLSDEMFQKFQEIIADANVAWEDMRKHDHNELVEGHKDAR